MTIERLTVRVRDKLNDIDHTTTKWRRPGSPWTRAARPGEDVPVLPSRGTPSGHGGPARASVPPDPLPGSRDAPLAGRRLSTDEILDMLNGRK